MRHVSSTAATRARSTRFNVGEHSFIALSCRRFRGLACRRDRGRIKLPIARADGARGHLGKNEMRTELAYSATSSSAEPSFWPGACTTVQARQPEIVCCPPDSPPKTAKATRRPQRPPSAGIPQRARGSLSSARDRGAPRRRRGELKHNHKTPGGHRKQG